MKPLNPAYDGPIEEIGRREDTPGCAGAKHRGKLVKMVSPDACPVCHGRYGMTFFCPVCEMDCGCREYS